MNGCGDGVVKALIAIGREVDHDARARRHRTGYFDIEHDFAVGIGVHAGLIGAAIDGDRT